MVPRSDRGARSDANSDSDLDLGADPDPDPDADEYAVTADADSDPDCDAGALRHARERRAGDRDRWADPQGPVWSLDVPAGASNLVFQTSGGSGDADL